MSTASCRIIVPIYRLELTPDEQISLTSIRHHLSGFEICFAAPRSLDLSGILREEETVERYDDTFFKDISGYNRLLKSEEFYTRHEAWEYILITQLDCLIFSDDLKQWTDRGWDYLAAPWFKAFATDHRPGLWRVGNGGLSLRRVSSHQRVLRQEVVKASIYPRFGNSYWKESRTWLSDGLYGKIGFLAGLMPAARKSSVVRELNSYPYNEDVFWSIEARKFDASFRVATAEEALPFAFEVDPRWCYATNGGRLPFGCHAWTRYDRAFWEEFAEGRASR
jgi:Protein of unknown function (DUF5672)